MCTVRITWHLLKFQSSFPSKYCILTIYFRNTPIHSYLKYFRKIKCVRNSNISLYKPKLNFHKKVKYYEKQKNPSFKILIPSKKLRFLPSDYNLYLIYQNARSPDSKVASLHFNSYEFKCLVRIFSHTWLNGRFYITLVICWSNDQMPDMPVFFGDFNLASLKWIQSQNSSYFIPFEANGTMEESTKLC